MVKRHELLRGRPYQGDLALLEACVDIIVHCTALLIDLQESRKPGFSPGPEEPGFVSRPR